MSEKQGVFERENLGAGTIGGVAIGSVIGLAIGSVYWV
jgi:hypothetical protein